MNEQRATEPARPGEDVRSIAAGLLASPTMLAYDVADRVIELMPELRPPEVAELVRASCAANMAVFLDHLGRGVATTDVVWSPEVQAHTRALVRLGLPLDALLRGYRRVSADLISRWAEAVADRLGTGPAGFAAVTYGTAYSLEWEDAVCEQLALEHRAESDRLARERSGARLEEIVSVLADDQLTTDAASHRLRYRVRGTHRAIVLADCSERLTGNTLSPALRAVTSELAIVENLAVQPDGRTLWCWLRWPTADGCTLPLPRPPGPVRLAAGRPGYGLEGFRRSHRQASEAMGIAELADRGPGTVTEYDDVEIAVVCAGVGVDRTREYIDETLGPLAGNDDPTRRLRETLTAYFEANANFRATAARLGVHHNTVRYRLAQVERLLGRPVDERRLALEVALHLADVVGSSPPPSTSER